MPVSQELIKGTVVPVVLALLEDRARKGYEMVQAVNARTNGALVWSEGTLYPVLHKLEADGFVAAEWRDATAKEGGRPRRYYTLTRAGRRELKRRSAEWRTFATAMGEFFGRVRANNGPTTTPGGVR
jgi:DNA-binding PadR family transcriptional regulator